LSDPSTATARGQDGTWIVIDLWRSAADADARDVRWDTAPIAQHFISFVDVFPRRNYSNEALL
jgi:hypothetical protein